MAALARLMGGMGGMNARERRTRMRQLQGVQERRHLRQENDRLRTQLDALHAVVPPRRNMQTTCREQTEVTRMLQNEQAMAGTAGAADRARQELSQAMHEQALAPRQQRNAHSQEMHQIVEQLRHAELNAEVHIRAEEEQTMELNSVLRAEMQFRAEQEMARSRVETLQGLQLPFKMPPGHPPPTIAPSGWVPHGGIPATPPAGWTPPVPPGFGAPPAGPPPGLQGQGNGLREELQEAQEQASRSYNRVDA